MLAERILRYAVGFIVGIWIARYVGPQQYGLLNYALAVVTVLSFLGTLGLDGLAVRDLVRRPHDRDEILGTLLSMRLVGGFLLMSTVAAGLLVVTPDDDRALAIIVLIALALSVQAFESIDCWFQSIFASRFAVAARVFALLSSSALRIVLILVHAPLVAFAWAILVESVLVAVGMLVGYVRSGASLMALRPQLARARALIAEGWPMMLTACLSAVYLRVDQVMLGHMASFAEVGAYAVAARVVEASYIIPAVLMSAVFPAMVKSREVDMRVYEVRIQRLFDMVVWFAMIVSASLAAFAPTIVDALVGGAYADAVPALAVLAWMPVWVFFGMLRQRWLIGESQLRVAMSVEVLGCVLNVCCNLVFIPGYGAVGAAAAAVIAAAGSTVLLAPFVPSIRQSLRMFLNALVAPLRILQT